MFRQEIHFTVNGKFVSLSGADAFAPLSDTLRYCLRQTGTKVVCAEGDCGACTVMHTRISQKDGEYRSINSCIFPSFLADGCHIVTVEGLAQEQTLHEVQESMVRNFGGQCGFCTPGFVMSITNLYEHHKSPDEQNIKNYLTGNLCRCTGYLPIIDAAKDVDARKCKPLRERFLLADETVELAAKTKEALLIQTKEKTLFAPRTLAQAAEFKREHPSVRIFSGATDIGVQINKGKDAGAVQMSLHLVDELYEIALDGATVSIGARVTLERLERFMEKHVPAFAEFLHIFASPQIKNSATLVGNLANGSPIADTIPFLMTMDADIQLMGPKGPRFTPISEFFTGYKSFAMEKDEFLSGVRFTLPDLKNSKLALYKVSQRRDLDISCVNSSFLITQKNGVVEKARIAFGGVGATATRLPLLEKALEGKALAPEVVAPSLQSIAQSIAPISDMRGSKEFRTKIAQQLFTRFTVEQLGL